MREVPYKEAIVHSLWEAHVCIGQWAFCACLAMLRKSLDLWSAEYRDRHNMKFDKSKNEKDTLYWRLVKIANENKLYRDSIDKIINELRLDANEALHDSTICFGGQSGNYNGLAILAIRQPYIDLHQLVSNLITTTMQGLDLIHSNNRQWRDEPHN